MKEQKTQNEKPHPFHNLNLKNQVRFLSEFINVNKQLKHKQYKMQNINEMLLKLECFQYDMLPDLNMGYYHIRLS